MNVLSMGLPFGTPGEPLQYYQSRADHEIRTLAISGKADYHFSARDTAQHIIETIQPEWRPDLLLCWCPERLPPPLEIEACPIRTAAVVSDWTVYYPQLEHNLARYDVVITDRLGERSMRAPGVSPHYIGPLYSHRTGVHRHLHLERDIDIVFAGNLNPATHAHRGRLLEKVASLADRRRVVIASGLPPEEYAILLNRARIAFNFALRREMNLRSFEALACGALLFVEDENLEAHDYLKDGESAVFYSSERLVEQLEAFLDCPGEMARIAAHGHARGMELAGENRLDGFIDALKALPSGGRVFHEFSEEEKALAEVLQYVSSMEDAQRDYGVARLREFRARFAGSVAFQAAHGCAALERISHVPEAEQKALTQVVLDEFRDAATHCMDAVPLWMNLAFVARQANARAAEGRFLELALEAHSTVCGGLLAGQRRDPFYGCWRDALAFGEARVQILWAAAAFRRAVLAWEAGDVERARDWANSSISWLPDIAGPYRTLAQAAAAEGQWNESVSLLERSLSLTSLDSEHRMALIEAYCHAGRVAEARALAEASITLFSAWWGAEHAVQEFRRTLDSLSKKQ